MATKKEADISIDMDLPVTLTMRRGDLEIVARDLEKFAHILDMRYAQAYTMHEREMLGNHIKWLRMRSVEINQACWNARDAAIEEHRAKTKQIKKE